jgi:hypothetical protein
MQEEIVALADLLLGKESSNEIIWTWDQTKTHDIIDSDPNQN